MAALDLVTIRDDQESMTARFAAGCSEAQTPGEIFARTDTGKPSLRRGYDQNKPLESRNLIAEKTRTGFTDCGRHTERRATLDLLRDTYNQHRPHQSLSGHTPGEAWDILQKRKSELKRPRRR
jgi:hypothetical protein